MSEVRPRLGRLVVAVTILLGVVAGIGSPASAHAQLQFTEPASGAVLGRSPARVVCHFSESVEVQFGAIRVFNSAGSRVDSGTATHLAGDARAVSVPLPADLPPGGYVVTWRVISADSHPVHGAFTFQIGTPTAGSALRDEAAGLLSKGGGSRTVGLVFGAARLVAFLALAVLVGGLLFVTVFWLEGRRDKQARRLIWGGLITAVVATVAAFLIQGPYAAGLGLRAAVEPNVVSAMWHTRFGAVTGARVVLLAMMAVLVHRILREGPPSRSELVAASIVGLAVVATPGLAGHAATGSLAPLALAFDIVHVGAASIWFGGLAVIAACVVPALRRHGEGRADARAALTRFSKGALLSVIAIAVSGGFAAWRQIGTPGAVTGTAYGRLVLAKTVGFILVLGVASVSRRVVHGPLARAIVDRHPPVAASTGAGPMGLDVVPPLPRLARAIGAELAIVVVVFGFTAALVNAQPANQAYSRPYSTEVHAGPDLVDVTIDPAKAGLLAFHAYVLSADGAQVDVPEVNASMSQSSAGIDQLAVPLVKAGPGHYAAYRFEVPLRGTWTVYIRIRTTDIDVYNATPFKVRIR